MYHVRNVHCTFDDPLFPECCHAVIENQKWIKLGKSYSCCQNAINLVVLD